MENWIHSAETGIPRPGTPKFLQMRMAPITVFILAMLLVCGAPWCAVLASDQQTSPTVFSSDDELKIGVLPQPDAIPFSFAAARPIFARLGLAVKILTFSSEEKLGEAFTQGGLDAVICDLPLGIVLAENQVAPARIIRSIFRSNPYRPKFALVTLDRRDLRIRTLANLEGHTLAVPKGIVFDFHADRFLLQIRG